ncbi:MAG: helix-turn-helix domain-containing protein [Flavobacterium sp.]
MVNIDDFIKRLELILDYYGLSASGFADKIGVQRSSLSHLLSGRNKPSLDFILKILEVFPEIDLYWILNGKGSFPATPDSASALVVDTKQIHVVPSSAPAPPVNSALDLFSEEELVTHEQKHKKVEEKISPELHENETTTSAAVEKIIVFYTDGTFKSYLPQ